MVDAVEENEKEEKLEFTVMAIDQVIWARIYKSRIVMRVTGEEKTITIKSDDGLFPFYLDQFNTHKDTQLERVEAGKKLKEENRTRKSLAVVADKK